MADLRFWLAAGPPANQKHAARPPPSESPPIKNDDGKFGSIWLARQCGRRTGPRIEWCLCKHRHGFVAITLKCCHWAVSRFWSAVQPVDCGRLWMKCGRAQLVRRDCRKSVMPAMCWGMCIFRPWFAVIAMLRVVRGVRSCRSPRIIANDYSDGIRGTDEGRAVDSARSFAKTPSAESTSTPEMLPASQPQHGPARLVASGVSPKKVLARPESTALIACAVRTGRRCH